MHISTKPLPDVKLRGGEESLVVLHRVRGENVVVKIATGTDTEAKALRLAGLHGVPVPKVHELAGSKLYLEYIPGWEPRESDVTPGFLGQFAGAMRKLHGIKAPGVGSIASPARASADAWKRFLKSRFRKCLDVLERTKNIKKRERNILEEKFEKLAAKGERQFTPVLCHGDLHLYNVRLTPQKKLVMLDFNESFFGDPLFDFAPFKYFCPRFFARLRRAYSAKQFVNEKDAFRWYSFEQDVEAAAFYAGIGKAEHMRHALGLLTRYTKNA